MSERVDSRRAIEAGLAAIREELLDEGMPVIDSRGGMIRPLVSHAVQRSRGWPEDDAFWRAVAAIQYAHEASIVHDDILDGAGERRGEATYVAERGVKAALVRGDHLLTCAFRLAAATGSLDFVRLFARSVERTVDGEVRQAGRGGERISEVEYRGIVADKSGALLGCAAAAGAGVRSDPSWPVLFERGRQLGVCYQMLDDLVDYCPGSGSGKPCLQDYRNRNWTWPLAESCVDGFELEPEELLAMMHSESRAGGGAPSPARRCLARLHGEIAAVRRDFEAEGMLVGPIPSLLEEWGDMAAHAVAQAERHARSGRPTTFRAAVPPTTGASAPGPAIGRGMRRPALTLPDEATWRRALGRHARSFSFAALWLPRAERRRVADVYAFCRFTDDLVDRADTPEPAVLDRRLDEWLALCRQAWNGRGSPRPCIDRVMRDAALSGVPFEVVEDLVKGVRMDLRVSRYASLADLCVYTHRVAGVVGIWLTRMFGVRARWVLERAALLGHAMQLTNILRDVGEDLDRGRVYLPRSILIGHGVAEADLHAMRRAGEVSPGYVEVVEEIMSHADDAYAAALEAAPELPKFFRRPVVVAARVYQGIHSEIRRNGYDNLGKRAHTSRHRKVRLAVRALAELRRQRPLPPQARVPGGVLVGAGAKPGISA